MKAWKAQVAPFAKPPMGNSTMGLFEHAYPDVPQRRDQRRLREQLLPEHLIRAAAFHHLVTS
jgi:hypothetical protein